MPAPQAAARVIRATCGYRETCSPGGDNVNKLVHYTRQVGETFVDDQQVSLVAGTKASTNREQYWRSLQYILNTL